MDGRVTEQNGDGGMRAFDVACLHLGALFGHSGGPDFDTNDVAPLRCLFCVPKQPQRYNFGFHRGEKSVLGP